MASALVDAWVLAFGGRIPLSATLSSVELVDARLSSAQILENAGTRRANGKEEPPSEAIDIGESLSA